MLRVASFDTFITRGDERDRRGGTGDCHVLFSLEKGGAEGEVGVGGSGGGRKRV